MRRSNSIYATIILATVAAGFAAALAGCASGGEEEGKIQLAIKGADQISLFSLPTATTANTKPAGASDVVSAFVTIVEIDARVGGTWTPVVITPHTIDLLKLDGKTLDTLGIAKLPMGHIDELRLLLDQVGDYVVLKSGDKKPLEVPDNGVVKVDGKLDLDACVAGIVILDFDPKIKIEDEGSRREYELTAKARIKTEELKGGCGDMAGGQQHDMAQQHDMTQQHDMGKSCGDMSQKPDLADACSGGIVCPMGQICLGGGCVVDPCKDVVCPVPGQMCHVVGGNPVCM